MTYPGNMDLEWLRKRVGEKRFQLWLASRDYARVADDHCRERNQKLTELQNTTGLPVPTPTPRQQGAYRHAQQCLVELMNNTPWVPAVLQHLGVQPEVLPFIAAEEAVKSVPKFYSGVRVVFPHGACECGAHKASGIGRGQPGHSSWCPWRS